MNFTPYWHLAWKEYRAVRLFWLAIIGLTVVGYLVVMNLAIEPPVRTAWIFNLALVAPVLFALGCAAAAFSGEQEEGTFEFLRAAPISSRQVLASKLCLTAVGTAVMFILLWPVAQWFNHSQLPEDAQLHNLLGLWLVAALEAIAWGTLFSLLTARPLLAVVLAMAAASTAAHLLAWRMRLSANFGFEFASYLRAVPWRTLAAIVVLGIDVYLGLHWLDGTRSAAKPIRLFARRKLRFGSRESAEANPSIQQLTIPQDRGAMFGHLLWHHLRQSGRLMIIFIFLQVALFEVIGGVVGALLGDNLRQADFAAIGPLVAFAALMGACVFLPDQERRNYRFFVEHNVSSRYVWITRQLPWMATLLVATTISFWQLRETSSFQQLRQLVSGLIDPNQQALRGNLYAQLQVGLRVGYYYLSPLLMYLSCVMISYSAGQWASMMIRSGILAGFCGLLLSGVLCSWALLMQFIGASWLLTVAPIPLVLLWATWLRAPDWVRENTTWKARRRAALAILAPAAFMLIALPIYRVCQIRSVSPGFDVPAFEAEATPEALATGDLYRKASQLFVFPKQESEQEKLGLGRPFNEQQREFLKRNAEALALELEASGRQSCAFSDSDTFSLDLLLKLSGHELEADGKLDEALERYLSATHVVIQFAQAGRERLSSVKYVFQEIIEWAALEGQTPERIRTAIAKLQEINVDDLKIENAIKTQYLAQRRLMLGDTSDDAKIVSNQRQSLATAELIDTLMPWERWRALSALNVVTANVLDAFQQIEGILQPQEQDPASKHAASTAAVGRWPAAYRYLAAGGGLLPGATVQLLDPTVRDNLWWWQPRTNFKALDTTYPTPAGMDQYGAEVARDLVEFEALRRGTMIVLALQAYRLEHGELPETLQALARAGGNPFAGRAFFEFVPLDPFSGDEFRYFPQGIPDLPKQSDVWLRGFGPANGIDNSLETASNEWRTKSIVAGVPGIWSTGPDLIARQVQVQTFDPQTNKSQRSKPQPYYWLRWPGNEQSTLPNYEAWPKGIWFPIPAQQK